MSVDTAFQPKGPTVVVDTTPTQIITQGTGPLGMVSFRCTNLAAAAQRLGWGPSAAKTTSTGPAGAGIASATFSIIVGIGATVTLELPSSIFFVAANAAATGFEITPGQGVTGT